MPSPVVQPQHCFPDLVMVKVNVLPPKNVPKCIVIFKRQNTSFLKTLTLGAGVATTAAGAGAGPGVVLSELSGI